MADTEELVKRLRSPATHVHRTTRDQALMNEAAKLLEENRRLVDELVAGLEPFAKASAVRLCGEWRDDQHFGQTDVAFYLTFGDLRRAAALLSRARERKG